MASMIEPSDNVNIKGVTKLVLGVSAGPTPRFVLVQACLATKNCYSGPKFILENQKHVVEWVTHARYTLHKNIHLYIGFEVAWVEDINFTKIASQITSSNKNIKPPHLDGACCSICKNFAMYANEGFTCFSCRQDPYRSSVIGCDDDE